jgi:hypothetical protein
MIFIRVFLISSILMGVLGPIQSRAEGWSIDSFLDSLARNEPRSIEEALRSLPEGVRSNYTLLYHGHGLRGTTYQRPGVILFSNRGDYAITFGDASLPLGNEIEVARFDHGTSKVDLFKAVFAKEGSNSPIQIVKNPAECVRCHTADPKFLWATYARWPGIYGSNDDSMVETVDGRDLGHSEETRNFTAFRARMPGLDRYRTLLFPKGETGIPPNDDDSPYSPYTAIVKDYRMILRPNLRLTTVVTRIDGLRAARKIMESPTYAQDRVPLLRAFLGCPEMSSHHQRGTKSKRVELLGFLRKMGISMNEFQANILELPVPPKKYPYYYDGITDLPYPGDDPKTENYYAWGNNHRKGTSNSIAGITFASLYTDVIRDYPELPASYHVLPDAGYYKSSFEDYPSSKAIAEDFGSISPMFHLIDRNYLRFCAALSRIEDRRSFGPSLR